MDDTPRQFIEELRTSILKKRVGQIALAIVLAEAVWRFIRAITWYLIVPTIARFVGDRSESVLFTDYKRSPMPWDNLAGSLIEFVFTIIVVFYLNRWIHKRPVRAQTGEGESTEAHVIGAESTGISGAAIATDDGSS